MTRNDFIQLEDLYSARNYSPAGPVLTRGKGVWVWDTEGNRYLDCVSGYGAVNQGHCHPKIFRTLVEQAEKLSLVSRAFRTDQIGLFSKEICELTGSARVLLMNSGAEAVETALKTVRKWGYVKKKVPEDRAEIIVCDGNFHGRTITVVGFSSIDKYRNGFGPFTPGFIRVPYGDLEAMKQAVTENTVGIMVEPIQGEGGMVVPPAGYLAGLRDLCTEKNIKLVFDEIQSGLGRTGELLGEEYESVKADVCIIGKSLGGGFCPVSAVLARGDELDVLGPGEHGSTFGGNPLACAVGRTALSVLTEEKMIENAAEKGAILEEAVLGMRGKRIAGVRGRGMMLGIELNEPAAPVCKELIAAGLLCNAAGESIVRFTPPLTLNEEQVGWALERLEEVLE
jgi:ornithine--oxo-acid transaminase